MLLNAVFEHIDLVENSLDTPEIQAGREIYQNGDIQILTQSQKRFEFLLSQQYTDNEHAINIEIDEEHVDLYPHNEWDKCSYACLLEMEHELKLLNGNDSLEHKKYTRKGMVKRVLEERLQKAIYAKYRIKWASNIYGDHILTNEKGIRYKIFLRDFEAETGYSDSKDSAVNKLGTTKHIMYAYREIKANPALYGRLSKSCPFVEIFTDPLNEYRISYFYPHKFDNETNMFLSKYFKDKTYIEESNIINFSNFITEAQFFSNIVIRPEVREKVEFYGERKSLEAIRKNYIPNFSTIHANLYEYQKEGVNFAATRKHAIIADEMGLGKTLQAIGTAIQKKELLGFSKTLIVCPASLKSQWKKEIEKFTDEKAHIIQGLPNERFAQYKGSGAYFLIVNYETVLRDQLEISKAKIDFLILDEAQKVKNYATKTASAIKNINRKHVLIITGTPIENKLIDIFSIISILDPHFLGPLWEFSYQHCLFDTAKINKINGYYNLKSLKERLKPILLRREKRKVLDQLPNVGQFDVPVSMTELQADYHASFARGIAQIISKKFFTAFDLQRLQQLLTSMRMVCNSTYLIDNETNESPKLEELRYILLDKLDLKNQARKVIIFSEWVKTHKLIGQLLRECNIGFAELNGQVPVSKRGELIKRFETNESCKVFLSTEAGGAGLNLQVADVLINFELPWNPAKKNQRIGRIDRLGQKSGNLTVFNLITENSIEKRIALGLLIKQSLFESVLNEDSVTDFVDFSEKGRSQFLKQLEEMISDIESPRLEEKETLIDPEQENIIEPNSTIGGIEDDTEDSEDNIKHLAEIPDTKEPEKIDDSPETKTEIKPAGDGDPALVKAKQMEEVMNNGMQFLTGLFQMTTGQKMNVEDQKIEVNKETGEVTMKFKLPL